MGKEKFSPGEWIVSPEEEDKNYIRIRGSVPGGIFKIANVIDMKDTPEQVKGEARANANLIAASPDLLYSCDKALLLLSKMGMDSSDEYQSMLYATKKARGEL